MRIETLTLHRYGPFEALSLDFDIRPGVLNLLMAPNGAGKTVLRRAIRDLLFGIHGQTPMGFRHGYSGMKIAARVVGSDGARVALGRRKGQGNTLVDGADATLDPGIMRTLIGLADERMFDRLFAMDSTMLREGGRQLLEADGDLAQAIFAASGGIAGIREVVAGLETERDALAPGRKTASRPLFLAIDRFDAARADLDRSLVRPREWDELTRARDAAAQCRAELARSEATCRARIETLERVVRVRPFLARLAEAEGRLGALGAAPRLPGELDADWRAAQEQRKNLQARIEDRAVAAERLATQLGALRTDDRLLAAVERIEALRDRYGETTADRRDLPRIEAERAALAADLERQFATLGIVADGEPRLPDEIVLAEARTLCERHRALVEKREAAARAERRCADELAEANGRQASLPAPADVRALKDLVREAARGGDPVERLKRIEGTRVLAESRMRTLLGRVRGWSRGLEPLLALVPPPEEACRLAGAALAEARDALAIASADQERADARRQDVESRLTALRREGDLPEPAAVDAARVRRDAGWQLIRRLKFDGTLEDSAPEIGAFAGAAGLPSAFERAVDAADRIADARDRERQRLARLAELEAQIADARRQAEAASAAVVRRRAEFDLAHGRWASLAAAIGQPAEITPADLSAFVAARDAVLEAVEVRAQAVAELEAEHRLQAAAATRLAHALDCDPDALSHLLASAEERVETEEQNVRARGQLAGEIRTCTRAFENARRERDDAERAQENCAQELERMRMRLGRPEGETPDGLLKAIELFGKARQALGQQRDLDRRAAGMRRNIRAYEEEARALVAEAAFDLSDRPLEDAVSALRRRLQETQEAAQRRAALAEEAARLDDEREDTKRELDRVDRRLADLRGRIGAETDETAWERLRQAAELRAAEAARAEAMKQLLDAGDARSPEELAALVREHEAVDIDLELNRCRVEAQDFGEQRDAAVREIQELERDMADRLKGSPAADAEARRQEAAAAVARLSADGMRLDLAVQLLRAALDRLRAEEDRGIVGRIGAAFARLTDGAYAGVETDEDSSGRQLLTAVESDRKTPKRIDELSEGTRDQLFLAMRTVMIREYAERSPVPPFVADDLLQTFDDARSFGALRELVELSRSAQVILLTHHRHVLDLARELPSGQLHVCRLLEGDVAGGADHGAS